MPEPLTLAAIGVPVLTEGIKFLYGQAGEAIKRWRERRDSTAETQAPQSANVAAQPSSIFEGQLSQLVVHFDAVEKLQSELRDLRRQLTDYVEGIEPIDGKDQALLETTDALRQVMEAVYRQRITFKGENRPKSGTLVEGEVDIDKVAGYAAGVRARIVEGGTLRGRATADEVSSGGEIIGADVDTIRGSSE